MVEKIIQVAIDVMAMNIIPGPTLFYLPPYCVLSSYDHIPHGLLVPITAHVAFVKIVFSLFVTLAFCHKYIMAGDYLRVKLCSKNRLTKQLCRTAWVMCSLVNPLEAFGGLVGQWSRPDP